MRGHSDNRKRDALDPAETCLMISSICTRTRRKLPMPVSLRGRKNRCSPSISPVTWSRQVNRNSTHCICSGRQNADKWRKISSDWVEAARGSGPVHWKLDSSSRRGWKQHSTMKGGRASFLTTSGKRPVPPSLWSAARQGGGVGISEASRQIA